jgi:hypothetical protein
VVSALALQGDLQVITWSDDTADTGGVRWRDSHLARIRERADVVFALGLFIGLEIELWVAP